MEKRVTRVEARVAALEKQMEEIRRKLGLAPEDLKPSETEDDRSFLERVCRSLSPGGRNVPIHRLRKSLGWDPSRFDRLVETLRDEGVVLLEQGDPSGLSLKQIGDSYMGEEGELYTSLSFSR